MELVQVQREAGVGHVILDRVARRNALDLQIVGQLLTALGEVEHDPERSS